MLTSLSLTNFKAWKHIDKMRLAPITALFGTNSSGKSSILQFLLMLKQTADSADRSVVLHLGDEKSLVSLGTILDVAFKHSEEPEIAIGIEWELPKDLEIKDPETQKTTLFKSKQMKLSSLVAANGGGKLTTRSMAYSLGSDTFTLTRKPDKNEYTLSTCPLKFQFKRTQSRAWPLPAPVKFYGFADEVRTYHQNAGFLSELELEFEKMLRGIYYLGPLRDYPRREYTWAGGDPADMGRRGEYAVAAILAARERGERISRGKGKPKFTLEQYVAYWLKELKLIDEFRVEEIKKGTNLYRVHVKRSPGSSEVLITDVGFGVSQILPVLVLCYYAPEGSTILFEQPEIHLHPSVQRGLADVFIDAIKVRKVQIIVESHSEDFLRRLQRRVAEATEINEKEAAIYFCDIENGEGKLTELKLDTYGNFLEWPKDFFGDPMGDMAAMSEASMQRRGIKEEKEG
jgi:predicted ATPase